MKKRILLISAAMALCIASEGCGTVSEYKNTEGAEAVDTETMKNTIEEWLDIEQYEENEYASVVYLVNKNTTAYDFDDFRIVLDESTSLQLPETYESMRETEWTTDDPEDKEVKSSLVTTISYKNGNKSFRLGATTDNEEGAILGSSTYSYIYLYNYRQKNKLYEKNDKLPNFTVCSSLTENSDAKEIIDTLGQPSKIHFSDNSIDLTFADDRGTLEAVVSPDGSTIYSISLSTNT